MRLRAFHYFLLLAQPNCASIGIRYLISRLMCRLVQKRLLFFDGNWPRAIPSRLAPP